MTILVWHGMCRLCVFVSPFWQKCGNFVQASIPQPCNSSLHSSGEKCPSDLTKLHSSIVCLKPPWIDQTTRPITKIALCIMSDQSSGSKQLTHESHTFVDHSQRLDMEGVCARTQSVWHWLLPVPHSLPP